MGRPVPFHTAPAAPLLSLLKVSTPRAAPLKIHTGLWLLASVYTASTLVTYRKALVYEFRIFHLIYYSYRQIFNRNKALAMFIIDGGV